MVICTRWVQLIIILYLQSSSSCHIFLGCFRTSQDAQSTALLLAQLCSSLQLGGDKTLTSETKRFPARCLGGSAELPNRGVKLLLIPRRVWRSEKIISFPPCSVSTALIAPLLNGISAAAPPGRTQELFLPISFPLKLSKQFPTVLRSLRYP